MTPGTIPNLTSVQTLFQDRLLSDSPDILDHLTDGGPFMAVYDQAYMIRLMEILGEDFPGVHTLLGDERFATAARDYIRARPSTKRSVRWLGSNFTCWMRKTEPWRDLPVVADMAAFEWALGLAFDAPDCDPIAIDALAAVPPEAWGDLRFGFHPALNTLELAFDVAPFQQAVAAERDPEAFPETLNLPGTWAVWRDAETLMVRYRPLPADEGAGLSVLRRDGDFATLCEILAASGEAETAAIRAAVFLRHWIGAGWITGLK
ncbi:MAG: putative DNA-binding domain-containing protein [Rhodospirillales bacterium]|nr:putative DNA-binding domain-containing protein [Rhodospirillales bacterium]